MGTTLGCTIHCPACVCSLVLNPLIGLGTEVISFPADHNLWSKTSITCSSTAISTQQPYRCLVLKFTVFVHSFIHSFTFYQLLWLRVAVVLEPIPVLFSWRTQRTGRIMMQPRCYRIIGVSLRSENPRKISSMQTLMWLDVIGCYLTGIFVRIIITSPYLIPHSIVMTCFYYERYSNRKSASSFHRHGWVDKHQQRS